MPDSADASIERETEYPRSRDCDEKRLGYDVAVIDCVTGENGDPKSVTLVESWGKGRSKRAHRRVLPDEDRQQPPESGGITYDRLGTVVVDGTPYLVYEKRSDGYWWAESVAWCEGDHDRR